MLKARLIALIRQHPSMLRLLECVHDIAGPDAWIAAGAIRNLVWDDVYHLTDVTAFSDVDVVWFNRDSPRDMDLILNSRLNQHCPDVPWSVKNQAHMHTRNGDQPYCGIESALLAWPETATAVGARLECKGHIEVVSPYGLEDLFAGIIRPGLHFRTDKMLIVKERMSVKGWFTRWPSLTWMPPDDDAVAMPANRSQPPQSPDAAEEDVRPANHPHPA